MLSIGYDVRKLEQQGYSKDSLNKLTLNMVSGVCQFLYNCPLDMLIERELR